MTLKLCKRCSTMKNIRGNKIMCKRCEEEFSDKSVWKCVCDKEVLNKYKSEPGSLQEEMRQDIIDFIEKLMNKVRDNFKIAIDKSFEAGQNSVPRFKQHLKAEGLNS